MDALVSTAIETLQALTNLIQALTTMVRDELEDRQNEKKSN